MKYSWLAVSALVAATISLTGCASIVDGTHENVEIQTPPVNHAHCLLKNSKGQWVVNDTPGMVNVHKSMGPLYITCKKHGYRSNTRSVKSTVHGMVAGNLVFGGLLGAGVDAADGAAFQYPQTIIVPMGKKHHHHAAVKTSKTTVKKIK